MSIPTLGFDADLSMSGRVLRVGVLTGLTLAAVAALKLGIARDAQTEMLADAAASETVIYSNATD